MNSSAVATRPPRDRGNGFDLTVLVVGLVLIAAYILVALVAIQNATYDTWAALLVTPILIVISLPALARQAARENDRRLFWFLVGALVLKLIAGTFLRYFNTVEINGGTDSNKYHTAGLELFQQFRDGDFSTAYRSLTGTNFVRFVTGLVYAVVGPSRAAGFVVFSWFAFWGAFYFYKAFVLAVPDGRKRTYARFVFFLPSILFWPSSLGKEAWMMMGLGIAAYGAALILTGSTLRGLAAMGLGSWLAAFVRPYMPGMMLIGVAFAFLLRRRKEHLSQFAPISKAVALAGLILASLLFVSKSEEFLNERTVDTSAGVESTFDEVTRRSTQGGSVFEATVIKSPVEFPVGAFTVLFRPLITEAHTSRALLSALEGSFLLILTLIRVPWILAAFKSIRRQPFVVFAVVYTTLFIIAFSAVGNFGLLVRQRSLLMPLYVVLLCIPPAKRRIASERQGRAVKTLTTVS